MKKIQLTDEQIEKIKGHSTAIDGYRSTIRDLSYAIGIAEEHLWEEIHLAIPESIGFHASYNHKTGVLAISDTKDRNA